VILSPHAFLWLLRILVTFASLIGWQAASDQLRTNAVSTMMALRVLLICTVDITNVCEVFDVVLGW